MRFFGLGAQVMHKLGVSTQLLAAADIYPALERGVIDATEFSMPNMDIDLGFYQVAKYNYYPGWHQQSSIGELLMNKAAWKALDGSEPGDPRGLVRRNIYVNYAETEAMNPTAMNKMLEIMASPTCAGPTRSSLRSRRPGTRSWRSSRRRTRTSSGSPTAIPPFRKVYKTWGDAQSLKPTDLSE